MVFMPSPSRVDRLAINARKKTPTRRFVPSPTRVDRLTPKQTFMPSPNRVDRVGPSAIPTATRRYNPQPAPYTPPAPAPAYYAPAQIQQRAVAPSAPAQQFAPAAPVANFTPPPPPPRPARKIFNQRDWLAGDSDYKEQMTEYDRAIGAFKNRIAAKKAEFDTDWKASTGVTQKNQQFALDDLGEDFGARGLSYSGLFDKSRERTSDNFRTQIANLTQLRNRNRGQADQELGQYSEEVNISKRRALRNAIARMAQAQSLSDAELGY